MTQVLAEELSSRWIRVAVKPQGVLAAEVHPSSRQHAMESCRHQHGGEQGREACSK